jgi:hypothetical protein
MDQIPDTAFEEGRVEENMIFVTSDEDDEEDGDGDGDGDEPPAMSEPGVAPRSTKPSVALRSAQREARRAEQVRRSKAAKHKKATRASIAAGVPMSVHSKDTRGRGVARAVRAAKSSRRLQAAHHGAPDGEKICRFYTALGPPAINYTRGDQCAFYHSDNVAAFNRRRIERQIANPTHVRRVPAAEVRHGHISVCYADRRYGFIATARAGASENGPQRIFFHRNAWVGSAASFPETTHGQVYLDVPVPVRFVRAVDPKRPERWHAIQVSRM